MALFKDMLKDGESIFQDTVALDYDFQPKLIPYREKEQFTMASCIKPLFAERNGKNLLIFGPPGIGKTVATKHVTKELEEETDDIIPLYVNCWQKNTSYKVVLELCDLLNYRFTQNKKTEELFKIVKDILNKRSAVLVFDEIDKAEDIDFIYTFLEEIYRKSIFLITNYKSWLDNLDIRIKSRLTPELMEFKTYNQEETKGILKQRIRYAFVDGVWDEKAFDMVVKKTFELHDIRSGLYLMKESGNSAEDNSRPKILEKDVEVALKKLDEFSIKKSTDLEDETKSILELIKLNPETKIGTLFDLYTEAGGSSTYKTFQRKIDKLAKSKFIITKKIPGGTEGKTTIISYNNINKQLSDF